MRGVLTDETKNVDLIGLLTVSATSIAQEGTHLSLA